MEAFNIQRANILGVGISVVNLLQVLHIFEQWINRRESHYVCVTPAHGVMECQYDPDLGTIFNNSGLTTPDGMSIVWLLRLMGYRHVDRVYGPDLMEAVCKLSLSFGWRHFLYGGTPGIADRLSDRLQEHFQGLKIVGTYTPPFRSLLPEEDREVIDLIQKAKPDIVWVGISTPKQERWMVEHVRQLDVPVLVGVGAAFDFLSGAKPQAPLWIQRSGLEWLFRLAIEPGRLWRRYAKYPLFGLLIVSQVTGLKHFPMK